MTKTCDEAGKTIFVTEKSAAKTAKFLARQPKQIKEKMRPYLCPYCHEWHLTTAEADKTRKKVYDKKYRGKINPREY